MDFHVPEPTKTVKYSLLLIKPEVATLCLDYSADNPLTWPLVEVATPGLMSHVPGWVVYPTRVMELVSTSRYLLPRQTVCAEYESKTMNARFLKYPLNFDKNGVQRARIGMTKTDLEVWTAFMKVRNSWRAAHSAIAGTTNNAKATSNTNAADKTLEPINTTKNTNTAQSATETNDTLSKTNLQLIMAELAQQDATPSPTTTLRNELSQLREELDQANKQIDLVKERAIKAEASVTDLEAELEEQKKETRLVKRDVENHVRWRLVNGDQALAAKKRVKALEAELEKSKAEVENVKKKADEDLAPVLAALQKKRKAEESEMGEQAKKTKV